MDGKAKSAIVAIRVSKDTKQRFCQEAQSLNLNLTDYLWRLINAGRISLSMEVTESETREEAARAEMKAPSEGQAAEQEAFPPKKEDRLIDGQFLADFRREIEKKWPTLNFDAVLIRFNKVLSRHPDKPRTRGLLRGFFMSVARQH